MLRTKNAKSTKQMNIKKMISSGNKGNLIGSTCAVHDDTKVNRENLKKKRN